MYIKITIKENETYSEPCQIFNTLSANLKKWSNTLKQFVGKLPTNYLSGFDHFVGLALKGLKILRNLTGLKNAVTVEKTHSTRYTIWP